MLGLLVAGGRFRLVPDLTYFYRRHTSSISHRLSAATLQPMLEADIALRGKLVSAEPEIVSALDAVRRTVETALAFDGLVGALKQKQPFRALRLAAANPRAAALLRQPVHDRLRRLLNWRAAAPSARKAGGNPSVCVMSRQRITGNMSGSSAYLLSLCAALRRSGHEVHLLCPSPGVFGRWPWVRLGAGTDVFNSITLRGAWRLGPVFIARDPRIAVRALLTVLDRLGARIGLGGGNRIKPAPYSVGLPWTVDDKLFVARHAPAISDFILADYAFLTEGIAYALRPGANSAVVMHDLFSSRVVQFNTSGGTAPLVDITLEDELALLARAKAVIAIQAAEAGVVAARLPERRVITAPMAVFPVAAAQPGSGGANLLFIGSNTAPNVTGLAWFIDAVWPAILAASPGVTVTIAGAVADAFIGHPDVPGFRFLGPVGDLVPLYSAASVVISPLRAGSGLKIKLIEAMGHGKAIVATPVTVQGVEQEVDHAVIVADDPADFAAAVLTFLADPDRRRAYGESALRMVAEHFSVEACYGELLAYAGGTHFQCLHQKHDNTSIG
jgi:succinoglycan biosynthesis protein ExoO